VRETETLVRKALKGAGVAVQPRAPELSVVSEVLRTKSVHVQLQQKASGAARIVVDVGNSDDRDAIIEAIRNTRIFRGPA
jgi:hypothetical protein